MEGSGAIPMLNRRQFIATSAAVAGAAGLPAIVASKIGSPKGMRLVAQLSDPQWRRFVFSGPITRKQWRPQRDHRLYYTADSLTQDFVLSFCHKANLTEFGGAEKGMLFASSFKYERSADDGRYSIELIMQETRASRLERAIVYGFAGKARVLKVPFYSGVDFHAWLPPLFHPFPVADGIEKEAEPVA